MPAHHRQDVTFGNVDSERIGTSGGFASESDTIRIGFDQTRTFIKGIYETEVGVGGLAVLVDADGKLGTAVAPPPVSSSRRVKVGIHQLGDGTSGLLKLRPVSFHYFPGHGDGGKTVQYGLIAEEVAEIYPELVVLDKDGQPAGVRYHVLPAMLLNELQRQQRTVEQQQRTVEAQASRLAEYDERFRDQTRLIDELTARLSRLEAKGSPLPDVERVTTRPRSPILGAQAPL
jgi:hypothetical protein